MPILKAKTSLINGVLDLIACFGDPCFQAQGTLVIAATHCLAGCSCHRRMSGCSSVYSSLRQAVMNSIKMKSSLTTGIRTR